MPSQFPCHVFWGLVETCKRFERPFQFFFLGLPTRLQSENSHPYSLLLYIHLLIVKFEKAFPKKKLV